MNFTENKEKIIDELLDSGNQCLIRFKDRNELASEHDKRVYALYQCLEHFFLHGLKNENLFGLTREMISNSLSKSPPKNFNQFLLLKDNCVPNFWQFITFFLNKHEIERFTHLKHIKTSIGGCRAWIRSSLNEHSLGRYLKAMLDNGSTIVKQFYEEDAAIRDLSRQTEILELVAKLNTILFASTIDNPNLNSFNTSFNNSFSPFKGRKLDNQGDQMSSGDQPEMINKLNSTSLVNESEDKTSLNSNLSRTSSSKADLNLQLSRNSSYSSNYQHDDLDDKSDDNELNEPINSNILLTPIVAGNYSVTDQFLTTNYDEDEKASDLSNQSCNTSCSSTPAFRSKELENFERTKRLFSKELESSMNSRDDDSNNKKLFTPSSPGRIEKDERLSKLESHNEQLRNENKQLRIQLKKYIDAISLLPYNDHCKAIFQCAMTNNTSIENDELNLSKEISELQSSLMKANQNNNEITNQSTLERESIVNNALQQTKTSTEDDTALDYKQQIRSDFNTNAYLNYCDSVEYERKLVQVAEMFGEIVEYNDRLNRVLMQKDATIKVLKNQLVELRGPLPDNIQSDEDEIVSITSDSEHQNQQYNSIISQNIRPVIPLINIWIPSAFLSTEKQTYQNTFLSADQQRKKDRKVSSHHVYQIYIRIASDEWIVYKRYSQFYSIHQILKKKYQQISELEFPPKKYHGSRHAKVVGERRKKLETYLRNVLNILQNDNNICDRSSLIQVLPFLSETSVKTVNRDNETNDGESAVLQQDYVGL